ncbi:hypothetical protein [Streptomyces sp. NPDC058045]|uniref:hypothetical protein n=1 Tax=Streptomyces sp. NPDC058045 TaxID=3346311 RepID=UPI0036EE1B5A
MTDCGPPPRTSRGRELTVADLMRGRRHDHGLGRGDARNGHTLGSPARTRRGRSMNVVRDSRRGRVATRRPGGGQERDHDQRHEQAERGEEAAEDGTGDHGDALGGADPGHTPEPL